MRFECGPHPYSAGTVRAPAQCGLLVTLVMLHAYILKFSLIAKADFLYLVTRKKQ